MGFAGRDVVHRTPLTDLTVIAHADFLARDHLPASLTPAERPAARPGPAAPFCGARSALLATDGDGHGRINGTSVPNLDGWVEVDLEASACTGATASAPAAVDRG